MKIKIRVRPHSGRQEIVKVGENKYLVYLKSSAEANKANIEMLNLMAKHLGISATKLRIVAGMTNKDKVVEAV